MDELSGDFAVALAGFSVGLGLIVAIGAQNAFVLRQGLRGEHVFLVCLVCAVSDAALILAGVAGFKSIVARLPWIDPAMRVAGAAFLLWYGWRSARSAWRGGAVLEPANAAGRPLGATLMTCLAFTWLNPHVYLDTVVLVGTIATQFPDREFVFGAGAMAASFTFFFGLGYGAAILRPVFATPRAWRILDAAIAATMWVIAARLLVDL